MHGNRSPINAIQPANLLDPVNAGLVGWWMVQPEWAGGLSMIDMLGQGNPATLQTFNPVTAWNRGTDRPGGYGHLTFDGSSDYLSIGQPTFTAGTSRFTLSLFEPMSLACWLKSSSASAQTIMNAWQFTAISGWNFELGWFVAGRVTLILPIAAGTAYRGRESTTAYNDGLWHHVVGVHRGTGGAADDVSNYTIYVDGKPVTMTDRSAGAAPTPVLNVQYARIGARGAAYFNGSMDDWRIYRRALTDGDVARLYEASRQGYPTQINRLAVHPIASVLAGGAAHNLLLLGVGA